MDSAHGDATTARERLAAASTALERAQAQEMLAREAREAAQMAAARARAAARNATDAAAAATTAARMFGTVLGTTHLYASAPQNSLFHPDAKSSGFVASGTGPEGAATAAAADYMINLSEGQKIAELTPKGRVLSVDEQRAL